MSEGCLKGVWKVPEGCLKGVWRVSMVDMSHCDPRYGVYIFLFSLVYSVNP